MTLHREQHDPPGALDAPTPVDAGAGAGDAHHGKNPSAPIGGERKVEKRISDLSDIDAIRRYLQRIGAESRSLKSAVVRERAGKYHRDLATLAFDHITGLVSVRVQEGEDLAQYEPTEAEQKAITEAIGSVKWPELQPLSSIINLPPMIANADKKHIYEFRNTAGKIVMVHIRVEKDGKKSYVPWTYWDDQMWRCCEPDGPLPLYGADKLAGHGVVFIHEGAKAASYVAWMVAGETAAARKALADHPWGRELTGAAHVGWIGGAPSPHRTGWGVLAMAGIERAYIVADNDEDGLAAVPKISKLLRAYPICVSVVRFDNKFPPGFDLADHFPEGLLDGPSFADYVRPATWATRAMSPPKSTGKGRPPAPKYTLRTKFCAGWWIVATESKPMYVRSSNPTVLYDETGFNNLVQPFSDVSTTAALLKTHIERQVEAIGYEPGGKQGEINVDGRRCVNTWVGPAIRPAQGDPKPWLDLLQLMFPVEADRMQVMRWSKSSFSIMTFVTGWIAARDRAGKHRFGR